MRVSASISQGCAKFYLFGSDFSQELTKSKVHTLITILNIEIESGSGDIFIYGRRISKLDAIGLMKSSCDCLAY